MNDLAQISNVCPYMQAKMVFLQIFNCFPEELGNVPTLTSDIDFCLDWGCTADVQLPWNMREPRDCIIGGPLCLEGTSYDLPCCYEFLNHVGTRNFTFSFCNGSCKVLS